MGVPDGGFQTAFVPVWVRMPSANGFFGRSVFSDGLQHGDGLVDAIDRNPQEWNVSERDLRMFSSLAYHSPSELHTLFKGDYWWNTQYASIAEKINSKYFRIIIV